MFTVLSGTEHEYVREGYESALSRGTMLSMALRAQSLSLRDIAARLVITQGKKKGRHSSPATVTRMVREHDAEAAPAPASATG